MYNLCIHLAIKHRLWGAVPPLYFVLLLISLRTTMFAAATTVSRTEQRSHSRSRSPVPTPPTASPTRGAVLPLRRRLVLVPSPSPAPPTPLPQTLSPFSGGNARIGLPGMAQMMALLARMRALDPLASSPGPLGQVTTPETPEEQAIANLLPGGQPVPTNYTTPV